LSTSSGVDGGARAWGWVHHLTSGGTTPWTDWHQTGELRPGALPGAQQLELLRRLNMAAGSSAHARGGSDHLRTQLAERVLRAPAAGRGRADLPLVGVGPVGFGPRPVDPADLPAGELLRVASVLLAQDLVSLGPDHLESSWTRPWRLRYRLVGDPLLAAATTRHLTRRGRPPGGVRPFVVVAATSPLDELLAHTWTQRCFEHGARPWPDWLRFWSERGQLPPRADLVASVRRWSRWRPFVRIVTDPSRLPRALGVRRIPPMRTPGADQAELARRVAAVVGLLVPADQRPDLMRTFLARLPETSTPPVSIPASARPWIDAAAQRMVRDLRRADYPVVGDLADLVPSGDHADPGPAGAGLDQLVLDLAARMLVDPDWRRATEGREG
jgi:hypothetical protein